TRGEVSRAERLIENNDASACGPIAPIECPAVENRDPHGGEVPATDQRALRGECGGRVSRRCRFCAPETGSARRTTKRHELNRACGLDTRDTFETIENLIHSCDSPLRRSAH